MIITENSQPTKLTYDEDTDIVSIEQRVFGTKKIVSIEITKHNLDMFLATTN